MKHHAPPLRNLAVRNVPDQDVLERVLVFSGHARDGVRCADEVLLLERLQAAGGINRHQAVAGAEMGDRACPEHRADDRRVVSYLLVPSRSSRSSRELIRL